MANDNTEERRLTIGKVVAFILTVVAVPILFVATCVPIGFVGLWMTSAAFSGLHPAAYGGYAFAVIIAAYIIFFIGFGFSRASRTDNPGIRWGLILTLGALTIGAIAYGVQIWRYSSP